MNFFSRSKQKSPVDIVRNFTDTIRRAESASSSTESRRRANEDISRQITAIKVVLFGVQTEGAATSSNYITQDEPDPEQVAILADEIYKNDVLLLIINSISFIEFEVSDQAECDDKVD